MLPLRVTGWALRTKAMMRCDPDRETGNMSMRVIYLYYHFEGEQQLHERNVYIADWCSHVLVTFVFFARLP